MLSPQGINQDRDLVSNHLYYTLQSNRYIYFHLTKAICRELTTLQDAKESRVSFKGREGGWVGGGEAGIPK